MIPSLSFFSGLPSCSTKVSPFFSGQKYCISLQTEAPSVLLHNSGHSQEGENGKPVQEGGAPILCSWWHYLWSRLLWGVSTHAMNTSASIAQSCGCSRCGCPPWAQWGEKERQKRETRFSMGWLPSPICFYFPSVLSCLWSNRFHSVGF